MPTWVLPILLSLWMVVSVPASRDAGREDALPETL